MKSIVLGLDAETVPDLDLVRAINDADWSDEDAEKWLDENVSYEGFPRVMFHRIICISGALWSREQGFEIFSWTHPDSEETILKEFESLVGDFGGSASIQMATFNGENFDMQVIRQRAMKYGTSLASYWDTQSDRYNNFVNRFHEAHCDILQKLTTGNLSFTTGMKLEHLAHMCGLPGKIGVGGESVREEAKSGNYKGIEQYCEVDALITILLFFRLEKTRGGPKRTLKRAHDELIEYCLDFEQHQNPLITEFMEKWDYEGWL